MTNSRVFISWQPVLTDHQAFTFQALAHAAGIPVVAYVTVMEDTVRKAQGWADTQVSSVERRLIPKRGFLGYCYRQLHEHRAEVHLFASPFQQPRLILCILLAAWLGIEFYLISEPYSPNEDGYFSDAPKWIGKLKAAFRPMAYRVYALLLRRHAAGIFTISRLAFAQYQQAGISPAKLFPFGYFIPGDTARPFRPPTPQLAADVGLRIIFIGSLIRRKGVDLLQDAIQQLHAQGSKVSVDIYGPGDVDIITSKDTSICYMGLIPFGQAQKVIAQYDLLVLPSRYDGWGVVVNEALSAGVPVVCSDTTGAGAVTVAFGAGLCFTSGVASSLRDVLASLVNDPALLKSMRIAAPIAARALQPAVAARYMLDVIRAPAEMRPAIRSPWYPDHL
jgi:glycosyltransferase involved in cell wall biosynthesis